MDYQTRQEFHDTATAADLGLTPLAPAYTAPDWWLDDAPVVMDEPRYLCDADAWEWQYHAGPSEAALLEQARELATHATLRTELEVRELAEQVKDWQARAALEDEAVRQRDIARAARDEAYKTVARLENDVQTQGEVITDLREGLELVRNTLRDCGYNSGALHKRILEMHAELVQLRKQAAENRAATYRPQSPPAA